ncbi:hypothetical protein [Kineococcus aurantiacus]|uniref:Uncharacterized protein n=1 Tax=Kineococcus aurantiacus TaxID=37633 RepID=A0A7Y9DIW1_9ACTN|nr:hypothetical protein [Kineococcus aurantiacus]NYD20969.1 hypothetical protein [Kineococcus aurantiacus]
MTNDVGQPAPGGPPSSGQHDPGPDGALAAALARLDGLDAVGVHEHVEVYAAVDRALRERLAGAEG